MTAENARRRAAYNSHLQAKRRESCLSERRLGGGGGRGRESTRECVEAWQGRQTGNLYIHTHVCIIREMLEKSELDVRGIHVQAYMDPI